MELTKLIKQINDEYMQECIINPEDKNGIVWHRDGVCYENSIYELHNNHSVYTQEGYLKIKNIIANLKDKYADFNIMTLYYLLFALTGETNPIITILENFTKEEIEENKETIESLLFNFDDEEIKKMWSYCKNNETLLKIYNDIADL